MSHRLPHHPLRSRYPFLARELKRIEQTFKNEEDISLFMRLHAWQADRFLLGMSLYELLWSLPEPARMYSRTGCFRKEIVYLVSHQERALAHTTWNRDPDQRIRSLFFKTDPSEVAYILICVRLGGLRFTRTGRLAAIRGLHAVVIEPPYNGFTAIA